MNKKTIIEFSSHIMCTMKISEGVICPGLAALGDNTLLISTILQITLSLIQ